MARLSIREALQRSRSQVRARGHDWDVADAMDAIAQADTDDGMVPERDAVLATGSALRRAAVRSIRLLSKLTGLGRADAKTIGRVIDILDVPEAGDSLPNLAQQAPHHGRSTRHPDDVYPPPRDTTDPDDIGNQGA